MGYDNSWCIYGNSTTLLKSIYNDSCYRILLTNSTTSIILVGALVREFIERTTKNEVEKEVKVSNGISLSSGLVAGGSILGLIGVICQVTGLVGGNGPSGFAAGNGMAVVLLVILVILTALPILNSKVKDHKNE